MEINERDYNFMLKIKKAYENGNNDDRSIKAIAEEYKISRTKVRKILVTLGVIKPDITERALQLKEQGKKLEEIAKELGCSVATVSTYLPYDSVIYNGEEKSPGAIRHEKYRERNKNAVNKQVQRNEIINTERSVDMKDRDYRVLKLRLDLDIEYSDIDVLRKYGKVQNGISRVVLVPSDMTLHALHFVIQKLFGWQNGHLHKFTLPQKTFRDLTNNSFKKWCDYCGIYFRFPSEDWEDIYWDDNYDGSISFKTWLKRKYCGPYGYFGKTEHLMEAKESLYSFLEEYGRVSLMPSNDEWIKLSEKERIGLTKHPIEKPILKATCEEVNRYLFEGGGIYEVLERLKLTEILGDKASKNELNSLVVDSYNRYDLNKELVFDDYVYDQKMRELDGTALPLTKELIYEYDYGDGWEVRIALEDTYDYSSLNDINCETVNGESKDKLESVIAHYMPICIESDGLPVMDDVGGVGGYCRFLEDLCGKRSGEDVEELRDWAGMQGWTGRINKPEKML